ncbi:hypothetical protein ADUPG1_007198 [Aduncisulcus paluster]|uniref:Uncharacterized protein n=1 Tax=Aduncisulcus paluster TaxID=2918883 RepID=A0ABQ5KL36_9EUKA|nr:hypothetical protein ADUPG1_007198 [Aduncisulcus paluster]
MDYRSLRLAAAAAPQVSDEQRRQMFCMTCVMFILNEMFFIMIAQLIPSLISSLTESIKGSAIVTLVSSILFGMLFAFGVLFLHKKSPDAQSESAQTRMKLKLATLAVLLVGVIVESSGTIANSRNTEVVGEVFCYCYPMLYCLILQMIQKDRMSGEGLLSGSGGWGQSAGIVGNNSYNAPSTIASVTSSSSNPPPARPGHSNPWSGKSRRLG